MIYLGNDHRGDTIKKLICQHLAQKNLEYQNLTPCLEEGDTETSYDYPNYSHQLI